MNFLCQLSQVENNTIALYHCTMYYLVKLKRDTNGIAKRDQTFRHINFLMLIASVLTQNGPLCQLALKKQPTIPVFLKLNFVKH